MNPRISSIENLIARDPAGRNVFGLVIPDQLRLAAQSLRLARRVGIVTGFYIPRAGAGETDGPHGAVVLGRALKRMGLAVDYITDAPNAPILEALGATPVLDGADYLDRVQPSHLVAVERVGRASDGRYRNMRGEDISDHVAPLDALFIEAAQRGFTTIGIGDGGNEIGMGRVFRETLAEIPHGTTIASVVATDYCIAAGVSNWGAYGLTGALSVLVARDILPDAASVERDFSHMVHRGGAVDGVTHAREPTVDGLPISESLRMLEEIRRQIAPSPLDRGRPLTVGVLGFGEAGRAAARLLKRRGHRVRISDEAPITFDEPMVADGVETGGHSAEFLAPCDLVVASPGVRPDAPIRSALHARGVAVISELELAYQLCDRRLIAVTGTVGKRTTLELLERWFAACGRCLAIGGNKGVPLSALLGGRHEPSNDRKGVLGGRHEGTEARRHEGEGPRDQGTEGPRDPGTEGPFAKPQSAIRNPQFPPLLAVAVSSFQLETVVHFRPHIAAILNISEAHLDRHASLAEYARVKSRVFMNQHADDALILNFDDARVRSLSRKHRGQTFFISARQPVDRGAWWRDDGIDINVAGAAERFHCPRPRYPENVLTAAVILRLCGVDAETLGRTGVPLLREQ